MRKLIRFSFFIFSLFIIHYSLFIPANASTEFETSYQVRYQVNPNGIVHVSQDISLTNKFSNLYATQYSLNLQSERLENIQAFDELGPLKTEISQNGDSTSIKLKFNQQVVGTGKTFKFNLSFDSLDLTKKIGQVWEITVPRLANPQDIDNYQLQLSIPLSFGNPAYISPTPTSTTQENNLQVFYFSKNQIAQSGVSAAFGEFQVFDFELDYHLKNDKIIPIATEIALPPDTAFQKVYYLSLEPKPENVRIDEDGNWLAGYTLKGNQKLNIKTIGKVKIFSQPQRNFPKPNKSVLEKNLSEQEYWLTNDPLIMQTASKLKSIEDVYYFVVNYLDYDFERVKQGTDRLGALKALEQPDKAICMEFTDLFITLSRTIGIPAREINGYAYTTNPKLRPLSLVADILHSWPEYWDEKKGFWIPVDPTWEKTTGGANYFDKIDLNHFAFVIHGVNSQIPAPAGSYRSEESGVKTVQVNFGKFENLPESKIEVRFSLPPIIFSGIKSRGEIIIYNFGPTAIYNPPIQVNGEKIKIITGLQQNISVLPPFSNQKIPIEILNENWLKAGQEKITLKFDNQEFSQSLKIYSLILQGVLPSIGLMLLFISLGYFFYKLTVKKRSVTKEL